MAVKTVEAKLILAGEDRASRVIAQVEKATRGMAKAFEDVGRSNKATEAVSRLTRALDSQQRALTQVEEVRRRSAARASADYSAKTAAARLDTVTKALGAATAAQKTYDATRAKGGGAAATAETKRHADAVRKLTEEQRGAQRELRATQAALRAQDTALRAAKTAMKEFGVPVRDIERRERALKQSIDETTAAIKRQEAMRLRAEATHQRVQAAENRRQARREVRRETVATTAAAAGVVAAHRGKDVMWESVRNIKELDDAQRRQIAYTGITEEEQKPLIAQAKKIGQETPFSNTDVIKAQTAAMQGLPNFSSKIKAEIAEGILDNVRNYATLMETSLADGAQLIRSYLQTTGKDISTKEKALAEANKAVNQIVMTAKLGGMSGEDAAQYVKFATASATVAGLPTEATLAMAALARRGGLRGDEAGVFMRATASKLVAPTNKGRLALKAAGIDFDDYQKKPDKLAVDPFIEEVQSLYGVRLDSKAKAGLEKIFSDKKLIAKRSEFTPAVMDFLSDVLGGDDAKSKKSIAGLANRYRDSSMQGVDSFRLLQDAMSKDMTLSQINAWLTDKHGGKGAITQKQWDEFKSSFSEIGAVGADPDFAKKKTDYIMAGVAGSLENLHGSWENFTTQIGDANKGLIKSVADTTGQFLDMFSKLDTTTQQVVSLGSGAVAAGAGIAGFVKIAGGLFGSTALTGSATALTGSAAELVASARALDIAAAKLAGGSAASTATTAASSAAAATTGAAGAFARWAPFLGMTGAAIAVPWAAAQGNADLQKKFMRGLKRRDAERKGVDLPYLQADATKLRDELADIEKRTAEVADDISMVPVQMGLRTRKARIEAELKDLDAKIAERMNKSPIDAGLDAVSAVAEPTGRAIGEKTSSGIADGLKAKAPEVLQQGQAIHDAVEDIFKAGIGIPIRFTPDGGGATAGGSSNGLIRASYGGSATAPAPRSGPTYFGSGESLGVAAGGRSTDAVARRDPASGGYSARPVAPLPIRDGTGDGHVASRAERAEYIRESARKRGIDPDTALRVAQSEGFDKRIGDRGRSFGDFQLFTGGGLGNDALAAGIDVRDPKKWRDQADFALDHVKRHGWSKFHGAARVGIGKWQGIESAGGDVTDHVVEMQGRLAGIRRGRITSELRRQLDEAASETGVRAEVFSGGQPSVGRRTGSHRHDRGGAADVRLSVEDGKGGRRFLSMDDSGDRAAMEAFIRAAVKAGASGVGAGPGYMGPNGIHIGGGKPLAWGAGGKAQNAPGWVRRAHRDGMDDRTRSESDTRSPPPIALPAPPKMPDPIPSLPGGHSEMMRAADRMNQAADRFEGMRLNTLHTIELTGSGRDGARVKGMRAKSDGPIRADMGVSMPQIRSPRMA